MADRRMFTKKVTDDDNFMMLSSSAQALYLHLSMAADDDGFCNQISTCMFKAHASTQDLQALLEKRYIYQFENGVIVIKHWRMANALRKDRYTPTAFQEELAKLQLKDNGSYTMVADWLPDGCQVVADWLPQDRLDKDRLDKVSIDEDRLGKDSIDNNNTPYNPPRGKQRIVYYPNDETLNDAFEEFVAMRKKLRKPMTDRAVELAIKKLESLSGGDNDKAIEIVNQSIMNSWTSFYELKTSSNSKKAQTQIDWSKV